MGYFSSRRRWWEPSRSRFVFLVIAIVAFCLTEFGRHVYRPYVYGHRIADYGLADSVGNLGGIIVQVFLSLAILNPTRPQSYRLAAFFSVGYVLYEFAQPYLPKGVFDWRDILATVIGYGISVLLLALIWRSVGAEDEGNRDSNGPGG